MKNYLKNTFLAGAIALPMYLGTSITYNKFRTFPEIVEKKNIEGFPVTIIRTRSKNLIMRILDGQFKPLNKEHTAITNKKGEIEIDPGMIEKNAEEISKNWKEYEKNALIDENHPEWDFSKKIIYDNLKNFENKEKGYVSVYQESLLVHELKHARDYKNQKRKLVNFSEYELNAFSEELTKSNLALANLKKYHDECKKETRYKYSLRSRGYCHASDKIIDTLIKKVSSYGAISRMPQEDLTNIAKKFQEEL